MKTLTLPTLTACDKKGTVSSSSITDNETVSGRLKNPQKGDFLLLVRPAGLLIAVALRPSRDRLKASFAPLSEPTRRGLSSTPRALKKSPKRGFFTIGAPGGIRTHDPRLRRPILYPAELRAQDMQHNSPFR